MWMQAFLALYNVKLMVETNETETILAGHKLFKKQFKAPNRKYINSLVQTKQKPRLFNYLPKGRLIGQFGVVIDFTDDSGYNSDREYFPELIKETSEENSKKMKPNSSKFRSPPVHWRNLCGNKISSFQDICAFHFQVTE